MIGPITRIAGAYTVEVSKAIRTKSLYAGPLLVLCVIGGALLANPIQRDGFSDYDFIAYVTPLALNAIGFVMILAYCAGLISTELGHGTIRQVLVRPLYRHEFFLAKLLFAFTYAFGLLLLTTAASWGCAAAFGELHGIVSGGELVYTAEDMIAAYALGALLDFAPLCAGAAVALLLSTCTKSGGAAVGSAIGLWIFIDTMKYAVGIDRFVFTTYLEAPWQVFIQQCDAIDAAWFPMAGHCLATAIPTLLLSTAAAILLLHRKDLT